MLFTMSTFNKDVSDPDHALKVIMIHKAHLNQSNKNVNVFYAKLICRLWGGMVVSLTTNCSSGFCHLVKQVEELSMGCCCIMNRASRAL